MKKIITFLIVMFLLNIRVYAASSCTYQEQSELNNKAANVDVSYEVVENKIVDEENNDFYIHMYFNISITNVTEDFYVVVKNNRNSDEKTFYSSDAKDGIITFKWSDLDEVTNFTIVVYSTSKTNCPSEKFKTFYLTTPRFNEHSHRRICLDNEEFYLCQKYVTFAKVDDDKFVEQISKFISGEVNTEGEAPEDPNDKTITDIIFKFIDTYKWYILGILLVVTVGGVTIYKIRTKKQRELGL